MPLGFHVSKAAVRPDGTKYSRPMSVALREDMEFLSSFGFNKACAQIFVSGPQSFTETLSAEEKNAVRKFIIEMDAQIVIHGSYVDNPWRGSSGSIHNIKQEMRIAETIGANGVIIHLGSGTESSLKHVLEKVSESLESTRVMLWLEIHAAKSSANTYETPEKLNRLFDRIANCAPSIPIGLCIDTAHLYSCGTSLDTYAAAAAWIKALPKVPMMLHLNDSRARLGSGVDLHAALCTNIWASYHPTTGHLPFEDSGLCCILEWASNNNIVTILERDRPGLIRDLTLIQSLGYFQEN